MKTAAISFLASAGTSAALTPVVRDLAIRRGWLDPISSRKVHGKPVPRVGGFAIVVAFYVPLLALLFVNSSVGARFWSRTNLTSSAKSAAGDSTSLA